MLKVTRKEIERSLPTVAMVTLGSMAISVSLVTIMMSKIGFHDAQLHYTVASLFPWIITPAAAFPLVIVSQRLQRMKAELERLLRVDGLTAIPNRRAFFERTAAAFARNSDAAAMMIDIDYFKKVNDAYGHAVGDVVLSTVGHLVERIVAAAPQGGARIAARIGGEEFAVLVEDAGPKDALALAQTIVDQIKAQPVVVGDQKIPVTVSVGVAVRHAEDSPDELLRRADRACYQAKKLGRDRCCSAAEIGDRQMEEPDNLGPVRYAVAS